MNWKKFSPFWLLSLFFLQVNHISACGYYENEYEYQALIFSAKLPQTDFYRPFEYTMGSLYGGELNSDPNETDRIRNCSEWRHACQNKVMENDIYQILYKTECQTFLDFIQKKTKDKSLSKNSFVQYLLKKSNKDMLDYMTFAKSVEKITFRVNSRFESWDTDESNISESQPNSPKKQLENLAKRRIENVKSPFLTKRYAFQLCRFAYELQSTPNAAILYDKYFGKINPNDLMNVWSLLYKAHACNGDEAMKAYIDVFANCNEKKFRCVQLFESKHPIPANISDEEQSCYYQIQALINPGRALEQLKSVYIKNPRNNGLPFLVRREINKLEDWLVTPVLYESYAFGNDSPFKSAFLDPWLAQIAENKEDSMYYYQADSIQKAKKMLHSSDGQYLIALKDFIKQVSLQATGSEKDFYMLALAHLAVLAENGEEAKSYLKNVSNTTIPTLQYQKEVEELWLAMKTENTHSSSFRKKFACTMAKIQTTEIEGVDKYRTLFGLTLSLADDYLKSNEIVFGNLLRLRANGFRNQGLYPMCFFDTDNERDIDPNKYVYFWNNASVKDMDAMIDLSSKKDRSDFEKFACSGTLLDQNWYYDLKGTIAFRDNDLQTAYQSFSKLPTKFWKQHPNFNYLNEDPFKPKGLEADSLRKYNYDFNKATFVKSLIDLENKAKQNPKTAADCYNRLGSAFFNTSYWGNAWEMSSYAWSITDKNYSITDKLPDWMQDYMMAQRAQKYFRLALQSAPNNEQKAYANLMLHYINRLSADYRNSKQDKQQAKIYGQAFKTLAYTKTFKAYNCPEIEDFIR